ncbi:MAG: prolyl oligopeptidase family serine peptidase [Odoribacteraceae bacterium]|jgi:dipeptidyl aminopeptidase/acylaminoacyl peptidase|nr:prolyl oligopeptidase family serine peptidase [Odoribacteraceae bacterium]
MKRIFFIIGTMLSLSAGAQSVDQWLALSPVRVIPPAFGSVKNVDDQTFTPAKWLQHSFVNIAALNPAPGYAEKTWSGLTWRAGTNAEVVRPDTLEGDALVLYHAVYLSNAEWMKGSLFFNFSANAEVYVDGVKRLTYDTRPNGKPVEKRVSAEWIPGKHAIIVKSLSMPGDKSLFSAKFEADTAFSEASIAFSLSPKRGKTVDDVLNGSRAGGIQLSPSGNYLLMDRMETIQGKSNRVTHLYRLEGKEIRYSLHGQEATRVQWVPGEDRISFLIKEGEGVSLYIYDPANGQLEQLFQSDQHLSTYSWLPDRSSLLYTVSENYSDREWELRKLDGIEDRQAYYRNRSFLCKFDLNTGLHSRLTWGNLSTSLMDMSRDGQKILFATSRPDYDEYPFRKQSVYLMDLRENRVDTLWQDRLSSIRCSFSPDASRLLVSGAANAFGNIGTAIGKEKIVNGYDTQLYIYDLDKKTVAPITLHFNPSVSQARWHRDGNIYIIAGDTDYIRLFRYNDARKTIEQIPCEGDLVQAFSPAEAGNKAVYLASGAQFPTRVYTLDLENLQSTLWDDPSGAQFRNVEFGQVNDWDYRHKGSTIDGRFYLPANFDPAKKYPLIVYYYGGTSPVERTFGGRWPFNLYAANGYIVYIMQPSGATGFGQEFSARHQNNWGITTADEIIASAKAFIAAHPFVDPRRVGCMGASYGGFTTMLLQTRTDIFACAISHAGISSISSYWGEGYWGYGYSTNATAGSYPWNRKDIYVDQSPLFRADKVKNPILLLHGTADVNVPTGESIQFYTALKLLKKDVELVLIKNADHAVVDYRQRVLWHNTILAYFAKYLKQQPAWWENIYKDKNL